MKNEQIINLKIGAFNQIIVYCLGLRRDGKNPASSGNFQLFFFDKLALLLRFSSSWKIQLFF
jgi:hypothetical protein